MQIIAMNGDMNLPRRCTMNKLWEYADKINQYSGWNKDFLNLVLLVNISRNLGKLVCVSNISALRPRTNIYGLLVAPPSIEQKSTLLDWEERLSREIQNAAMIKLKETPQGSIHDAKDFTAQLVGSDLEIEDVIKKYKNVHIKHSEFGSILFVKQRKGRYDERLLSILNDGFYGIVSSHIFRENSTSEVDDAYVTALTDAHRGEINSEVLGIGTVRRFIIVIKDYDTLVPEDKIKLYSLQNEQKLEKIVKNYESHIVDGISRLANMISTLPMSETIEQDGLTQTVELAKIVNPEMVIPQETLDELIKDTLETFKRIKVEKTPVYQHENTELVLRGAINLALFDYVMGEIDELTVLPEHVKSMKQWLLSISQPLKEELDKIQNYDFLDKLDVLQKNVQSYYNKNHAPISLGTLTNNYLWFKRLDSKERSKLLSECVQRQMFMGFIYQNKQQKNKTNAVFLPNEDYTDANLLLKKYNIDTDDALEYYKYFS